MHVHLDAGCGYGLGLLMKIKTMFIGFLLPFLAACVTPQATVAPASSAALRAPRSVTFVIRTTEQTEFGSDQGYNERAISLFKALLSERLKALGYELREPGSPAELQLDIQVTAVKAGSQAARLLVGFGAGRSLLTFVAGFSDAQGREIARMSGGDSNTGTAHPFQSNLDMATYAASESVDQIEKFMLTGGVNTHAQHSQLR